MTITEIIERVARRQEVDYLLAEGFIREAIEEVIGVLDRGENVKIRGLGTLYWKKVRGKRMPSGIRAPEGWKLRFVPSLKFRERRTEMSDSEGMTKYGVELDDEKTKQASEKEGQEGCCPTCWRRLDDAGACPVHGTEPLEPSGQRP